MSAERLNELLSIIDRTPYIGRDARKQVAKDLVEAGRIKEATILRYRRMFAIRKLSCGHLHVREIGKPFDLEDLDACCADAEEAE